MKNSWKIIHKAKAKVEKFRVNWMQLKNIFYCKKITKEV